MSIPVMKGVTARTVRSDRLTRRVLPTGHRTETPVLFLHRNLSAATWWEETMLRLPPGFHGLAPDLSGFGEADPEKKIDARQGLGDVAADVAALLDARGVDRVHVVGNSLGACMIWRCLDVYPHQPMLAQTRATLDRYEAEGGSYREVVIADSGHVAFIEKPREFCAAFHAHIGRRTIGG